MPDKLPDRRSCRVEPKERMMKMTENEKNTIALFRYGVLAPLIQRQTDTVHPWSYFHSAQEKKFEYIDGSLRHVTASTMARWYKAYLEKGFDGLKPSSRTDIGSCRKLDGETEKLIRYYIDEYPRLPQRKSPACDNRKTLRQGIRKSFSELSCPNL